MPPFIPRKRRYSAGQQGAPSPKSIKRENLFEAIDRPRPGGTLEENKAFLQSLYSTDTDSPLSDVDSSDLEDVVFMQNNLRSGEEDDEESNWEDAIPPAKVQIDLPATAVSGDIEITLGNAGMGDTAGKSKKGPTKIERQIRISTHRMHVQFLLFHNLIRSGWTCDKMVHDTLLSQLPASVNKEVEKWKIASAIGTEQHPNASQTLTGKRGRKNAANSIESDRNQRDWSRVAERQENGVPNMSHGDPLIWLLMALSTYWKERFSITSPGLRKQGYKPLELLEAEISSFKNDLHDPEKHGERINGIEEFRDHAKSCKGSRDVGVQLFTALVRSIGIEARLVASLQPIGFGWGKGDEVVINKQGKKDLENFEQKKADGSRSDNHSIVQPTRPNYQSRETSNLAKMPRKTLLSRLKGGKGAPIDLTDDSGSSNDKDDKNGDAESLISGATPLRRTGHNKRYDGDQVFPNYWTEVVSPVTNEIIPVDPFILTPAVATNQEHLAAFEARGTKADKARQVFAYVIAYSSDGTAKDVTIRYLKKHTWPGSTKGARLPVERLPVYNRVGKIRYYEDFDWFKNVMSGYARTDSMKTLVDYLEEAKDLKALKRNKKEAKEGAETLQSYKTSAEFVLERHLRRDEAILPGSIPVKKFLAGKGENAKEEPVYKRSQVTVCRTSESWHKEGRQIKIGERPIKTVPVRAVTLTRKREVEEAERDGGGKLMQGMYYRDQTDWIIPPPIENGVIPKNAYGNMDCFVDSMIPKGASHIPLKSTVKICKRLNIDFAEACVGFEFGAQRAVPIISGVVVASEHEKLVINEWNKDEEERRIREEGKREKAALTTWRKMLMGLRILKKMQEDYGNDVNANMKEIKNPFTNTNRKPSAYQRENSPTLLTENPSQAAVRMAHDSVTGNSYESISVLNGGGFLPDSEHSDPNEGFPDEGSADERIVQSNQTRTENDRSIVDNSQKLQETAKRSKLGKNTAKSSLNTKSKDKPNEKFSIRHQDRSRSAGSKTVSLGNGTSKYSNLSSKPSNPVEKIDSRPLSKRVADRNSTTAVRSHYFGRGSDEEEGSVTDSSFKTPMRKPRGRPAKKRVS